MQDRHDCELQAGELSEDEGSSLPRWRSVQLIDEDADQLSNGEEDEPDDDADPRHDSTSVERPGLLHEAMGRLACKAHGPGAAAEPSMTQHTDPSFLTDSFLADAAPLLADPLGSAALQQLRQGLAQHPVIVFINPKSGGKRGAKIQRRLLKRLGPAQVFDIGKTPPNAVFTAVWQQLKGDPILG